jgi:uncharacterized protein DUF1707
MQPMRASDADRERAAASLARHAQDGRLDAEELEQRLERAYAAKTVAELDALQRDLPAEHVAPPRTWLPLFALAVLLFAAGLAGTLLVGHPIGPLFLLAFLVAWRASTPFRQARAAA